MLESGKTDYIFKKSYEISYALWRIAANMPEKTFSAKLFEKAIELVGFSANGDTSAIAAKLPGIELLVKFGVDVNCISVANEDLLLKEIGNLKSAIFDLNAASSLDAIITPGKQYEVDISDIFSGVGNYSEEAEDIEEEMPETQIDISESEDIIADEVEAAGDEIKTKYKPAMQSGKMENRQSAILERIRQIGNCQLSDIQVILPDSSERTIRYDLESMVQKNLIERVGTGGRSVYYKISDGVPDK